MFRYLLYVWRGRQTAVGGVLALLAVLSLSGCGGGNGSSNPVPGRTNYKGDGTSGVRGTVFVVNNINDKNYQPFPNATVTAQVSICPTNGSSIACQIFVVAQTQTDAQGNYMLPLVPGYYVISTPLPEPDGYFSIVSKGVTVPVHQYAEANPIYSKGKPPGS